MLTMQQARSRARKLLGKSADVRIDPKALDRDERLALDKRDPRRYSVRCTVLVRKSGWIGIGDYNRIEGQGDTWEEALAQAERSKAQAPYLYGPAPQAKR